MLVWCLLKLYWSDSWMVCRRRWPPSVDWNPMLDDQPVLEGYGSFLCFWFLTFVEYCGYTMNWIDTKSIEQWGSISSVEIGSPQHNQFPTRWYSRCPSILDSQFSHRSPTPRNIETRRIPGDLFGKYPHLIDGFAFGHVVHPGRLFEHFNECTANVADHFQWLPSVESSDWKNHRSSTFAYLISGIFIKVFLDVELSHGEAHIDIHIPTAGDRSRPFCAGPTKDPIELFSNRPVAFGHVARSIHHETPDEVILNHPRWIFSEHRWSISKKVQFTDGHAIILIECHIAKKIGLTKIIREIELNEKHARERKMEFNDTDASIEYSWKIADSCSSCIILPGSLFSSCPVKLKRSPTEMNKRVRSDGEMSFSYSW